MRDGEAGAFGAGLAVLLCFLLMGAVFFIGVEAGLNQACREMLRHDAAKHVGMPAVCEVPDGQ